MRFSAFFSFIVFELNKKAEKPDFTRLFGCAFGTPCENRTHN
mgnify:CR=1 FL=1